MLRKLTGRLVVLCASTAAVISVFALFSDYGYVFDLTTSFRIQYVIVLIPLLLLSLYRKQHLSTLVLFTALLFHAHAIAHFKAPAILTPQSSSEDILRLLSVNLQASNTNFGAMIDHIHTVNPDVLLVLEMTPLWHSKLKKSLPAFPFYFGRPLAGAFGIGVFSKLPFKDPKLIGFENEEISSIVLQLQSDDKQLTFIGTHPIPPMTANWFQRRNRHFVRLATYIVSEQGDVIVAGDFNITPWSGHYTRLLHNSRLRDSRSGFGIQPTWPTFFLPALIPIDHILVSENLKVLARHVSRNIGSDHRSVWIDFTQ